MSMQQNLNVDCLPIVAPVGSCSSSNPHWLVIWLPPYFTCFRDRETITLTIATLIPNSKRLTTITFIELHGFSSFCYLSLHQPFGMFFICDPAISTIENSHVGSFLLVLDFAQLIASLVKWDQRHHSQVLLKCSSLYSIILIIPAQRALPSYRCYYSQPHIVVLGSTSLFVLMFRGQICYPAIAKQSQPKENHVTKVQSWLCVTLMCIHLQLPPLQGEQIGDTISMELQCIPHA